MKKTLIIICVVISLIIIFFVTQIALYIYNQNENEKLTEYCYNQNEGFYDGDIDEKNLNAFKGVIKDSKSCYCRMYNLLLPRLLVYKVKSGNKDLKFIRPAHNPYIVPTTILEKADAFICYGIFNDIEFENNIANLYRKNTYAYDCGVQSAKIREPNLFFASECIGTDEYILTEYGQVSSKKIHTFGEKLKELNLEDKKVFLKMEIRGAEIDVLPDILKHSKNITGMVVVVRFFDTRRLILLNKLLKDVEKDFILVSHNYGIHEYSQGCKCKYIKDDISTYVCLTYINKDLADKKYLPIKQNYSDKKNYTQLFTIGTFLPEFYISWVVVIGEKVKQIFNMKD